MVAFLAFNCYSAFRVGFLNHMLFPQATALGKIITAVVSYSVQNSLFVFGTHGLHYALCAHTYSACIEEEACKEQNNQLVS